MKMDKKIDENIMFPIILKPANVILFKHISKVPSVERDLALVMDKEVLVGDVVDAIYRCDKNMIKKVSVFDIYIGDKIEENKKSVDIEKFEYYENLDIPKYI